MSSNTSTMEVKEFLDGSSSADLESGARHKINKYMAPATEEGLRNIKKKDENWSARLRYVRTMLGKSRADVAEKTGISHDSLRSWELGRSVISMRSVEKVVGAYRKEYGVNLSESWILRGEGEMPSIPGAEEYSIIKIFESKSKDFIAYIDRTGRVLHGNKKFEKLFKVHTPDIVGCMIVEPSDKSTGDSVKAIHKPISEKIGAYVKQALKGYECSFEYPVETEDKDTSGNISYVKLDCLPDHSDGKRVRGMFIFISSETPVSGVSDAISNDNNLLQESHQLQDETYGLPSIEVSQISFDKDLYKRVIDVAAQVIEKYRIKKDYKIISKIIDHLYQFAVVSNNIDNSYADTVVQIAVRTGAMPVEK
jgi:transcriptional regulator with XRE-family HTH domain